jgi:hypothetical protein
VTDRVICIHNRGSIGGGGGQKLSPV